MPEILALRDYQDAGIADLRHGAREHKHQILCAPTGSGKTEIAVSLMRSSAEKGRRAAFLCDRVNLVDQTSARLDRYGISHGVVQAGHWRRRSSELLQICSAQTLEKRGFFPGIEALYVDECHAMRAQTIELIRNRPDLTVVGLSATPLTKGLHEVYSRVVNVTTTNKLVAEGWLVPLKIYAAVEADMTGAKIVAGEWSPDEVQNRGQAIIGDIVSEWVDKTRLHFGGPVKTIVFSATVPHGDEICRQFQASGYNFVQISYKDASDDARRAIIEEFRKPNSSIQGIVSCEVLTKGFDVPDVMCGIAARPYRRSLASHIQQLGRVIRSSEGKTFALWLDHCGNVLRFWKDQQDIFENGVRELVDGGREKPQKEPEESFKQDIVCSCGFVLPIPKPEACPVCGRSHKRRSLVENVAGQMIEIGGKPISELPEFLRDTGLVWRQLCYMGRQRKGDDMEAARKFAQRQYMSLYGEFAHRRYENTEPAEPTAQLEGKVKSLLIRWAKGVRKAA